MTCGAGRLTTWRSSGVAVWDFFGIEADGGHAVALDQSAAAMPGARWFPGTRLNYAEHALRRRPGDDDIVAVTTVSEDGAASHTTWAQLRAQVAALAQWLREAGVQVASSSGGTDVASGFAGSAPTTDVWAGEISAPTSASPSPPGTTPASR